MAVSGICSSPYTYQRQFQQVMKDFSVLKADLSSNDLATSQQAYTALTQDLQNMREAQGIQTRNSRISVDLAAVGSALESGDLTGAQSAFATLTQDLRSSAQQTWKSGHRAYGPRGHHYGHRNHGEDSQSTGTSLSGGLAAVASALRSGDLTAVQSALGTLMQNLQSGGAQSMNGASGNVTATFQEISLEISITV